MTIQDWVTGPTTRIHDGLSTEEAGLLQYTHLIRSPSDPERSPRPNGGRKDRFPHRTLAKLPLSEIRTLLLGALEDGEPRTFNRIGVELFDMTADVMFTTPVNDELWQLVEAGELEHTLKAPILFRRTKDIQEVQMEDHQDQNQEGEELLKMLEEEREKGEEQEEGGALEPAPTPGPLLSLTEISKRTGIMYVTLKRYAVLHDTTDLAGLWEGEGRGKKYYPEAIEVFKRLKSESKKGRPRGPQSQPQPQPDIAPLSPKPALARGNVEDPFALSSQKKGKKKEAKKGAVKRPGKPSVRPSASLSTQEADRAMAAIERVQLMARYEAVREMVGSWVKEMERLEKVLGLGREEKG